MRLGRFLVVGHIGSGAMGTVHRAYDPQLDRSVALKVLQPQAGDADSSAGLRLEREARTLAKLSHPNVVTVHEVGSADGQVFVAMEMVDGVDFDHWLAARPVPSARFRQTLELIVQAGRGLAAAHRAGIVHRDLKPANILVGQDGRVRVADFGLARGTATRTLPDPRSHRVNRDDSAAQTHPGIPVGTPAYWSPEQRQGHPADALADQYAFCVTAWEALFGERLGSELQRPASTGWGSQALSVATALKRGLQVERTARFANMQELVEALTRNPVRNRRRLATLVTSTMGVAAVIAGVQLERSTRCDHVSKPADAVWHGSRRAGLRRRFLAVDWAGATKSWDRFSADTDAYVEDWKQHAHAACEAGLVEKSVDKQAYEATAACFEDRIVRLAGVLEAYFAADRRLVSAPFSITRAMGPLSGCVDHPGPALTVSRPLMRKLAHGLGVLRSGRAAEAADVFRDVLNSARKESAPFVEMHALAAMGEAEVGRGDLGAAATAKEAAYWMALEYGDDRLAIQLSASLASTLASAQAFDAAQRWLKPAIALATRVELDPQDRSELERSKGYVSMARGELDTAQVLHEESLRLAIEAWGSDHPDIVPAQLDLAHVLRLRGAHDRATQLVRQALDARQEHLGPWNPSVANTHSRLGVLLELQQRPAEAAEHFARAVDILTETHGRDHEDVAAGLRSLGRALQHAGDKEAAATYDREADNISARILADQATPT